MAKTGAKLKGRKRPKAVMEKAWETRRANKRIEEARAKRTRELAANPINRIPAAELARRWSTTPIQMAQEAVLKRLSEAAKQVAQERQKLARDEDRAAMAAIDANNSSGSQAYAGETPPSGWQVVERDGFDADISIAARALMVEARKKGAEQAIAQRLVALIDGARQGAEQRAAERHRLERRASGRQIMEKVVAGFLAEVEIAQEQYHGLPTDLVWSLPAFTLTKIVDALNEAGYTTKGRRNRDVATKD